MATRCLNENEAYIAGGNTGTVMSEIKSTLFGHCFIWKSVFQRPNRYLAFENVMVQIKHWSNNADLISDITVMQKADMDDQITALKYELLMLKSNFLGK